MGCNARLLAAALIGMVCSGPLDCAAQRVARVGYLNPATADSAAANLHALTDGLQSFGWSQGRNLILDARYGQGRNADLPRLAAELAQLTPEVIVANGPAAAVALRDASQVPVVFVSVADPVGVGLAKSLGRPEGRFTGLATLAPELFLAKQVSLMREISPRARRIAYLTNPGNPVHVHGRDLRIRVANAQTLEAIELQARNAEELAAAFPEAAKQKSDFMYLSGDPLPLLHRNLVAELALKYRLPVMFLFQEHVEAGGLISYGIDQADLHRRAAAYVHRILNGAAPRDLAIEEPTKYLLVVNMRTAKAIGVRIPDSIRLRADRVIE